MIVTPELEEVIASLLEFRVPKTWSFCYPSAKPLGSWMRDLEQRCELFQTWIHEGMPKVGSACSFSCPCYYVALFAMGPADKVTSRLICLLSSWYPNNRCSGCQVSPILQDSSQHYYRQLLVGTVWPSTHLVGSSLC